MKSLYVFDIPYWHEFWSNQSRTYYASEHIIIAAVLEYESGRNGMLVNIGYREFTEKTKTFSLRRRKTSNHVNVFSGIITTRLHDNINHVLFMVSAVTRNRPVQIIAFTRSKNIFMLKSIAGESTTENSFGSIN